MGILNTCRPNILTLEDLIDGHIETILKAMAGRMDSQMSSRCDHSPVFIREYRVCIRPIYSAGIPADAGVGVGIVDRGRPVQEHG